MNIANKLTVLRILMIPLFVALLMVPVNNHSWIIAGTSLPVTHFWAGLVFAVASLTDFLDGYLARKYHLVTTFGIFADPMADKLLVVAALILLVQLQYVPGWIVIIIISRELLVTGLRVLLAQRQGQVMAAAWPGKVKTFSQMLAILGFLWHDVFFEALGIPFSQIMLWICLIFTIYSGWDYFYQARHVFKD